MAVSCAGSTVKVCREWHACADHNPTQLSCTHAGLNKKEDELSNLCRCRQAHLLVRRGGGDDQLIAMHVSRLGGDCRHLAALACLHANTCITCVSSGAEGHCSRLEDVYFCMDAGHQGGLRAVQQAQIYKSA
eukprot:1141629-Pelagomonas_calceolata.AAC.8